MIIHYGRLTEKELALIFKKLEHLRSPDEVRKKKEERESEKKKAKRKSKQLKSSKAARSCT